MPKPYKLTRPYPLHADPEIVQHEGRSHVRVKVRGKLTLCRVSKDGTKYLQPSKRWYFDIPCKGRVKGHTDPKATEELAREMERKAERRDSGYSDPSEEHVRRPLAEHLKQYAAALAAKGDTPKHVRDTVARCSTMFAGCGFVLPLDADAGKASEWLVSLRQQGARIELPAGDEFRPSEAADELGITRTALARSLRRHRLTANGRGKARRVSRATLEMLASIAARGVGPATANHYVRAVRGFYRWLVRAKRIGSNPLESLSLVNAAVDVRRTRRELTADELRRLFAAARASDRHFRGLNGRDRYHLYLTATGTGFRASALANLTPTDFDLNDDSPTVTLAARFNKSRKMKVQPIPTDVAEALRDYLTGKPSHVPVWGGMWARVTRGAAMLRIDLEAAGIAYATEGPDGPEYADFHSLRHSFLTLGGRSGIDLRTLQELAGHSTPTLTARYSHRRLHDLAGAVGKLPNLVPTTNEGQAIPFA
jgi:integrase/recombinase XerC